MKRNIYSVLMYILLLIFSSCEDWFEVSAENEVTREDLLSSYEGFHTAINGIYKTMSETSLYGRELTYGILSCLGQNYDFTEPSLIYWYEAGYEAANYNYEQEKVKPIIAAIWEKAFTVIANCNIVIEEAESKSASFFPEGQVEKDLIIGEAKGVRALLHFEMVRLFAPAPIVDDGQSYIPYVTKYPTLLPERLPTSVVIDSVINDLKKSIELLAYHDTIFNVNWMSSLDRRINNNSLANGGIFFSIRGTRMNYIGANALLSRVYLYNNDKENAYLYAKEVYRFANEKNWYSFTSESNLYSNNTDDRHRKLQHDMLLSFYNTNNDLNYENFKTEIYADMMGVLTLKNISDLFGGDTDDFRMLYLIMSNNKSLKWEPVSAASYDFGGIRNAAKLLPIMHLSEVYYIMCEYLAENGQLEEALKLLNELRLARGCKAASVASDYEAFMDILVNDATREFLVEGQTFYLYKRLNRPMYNGSAPINMTGKYVLPRPDSETNFY